MRFNFALLVTLVTLTPATLAATVGDPCPLGDTECDTQLCESPDGGITPATCQSRPSAVNVRCDPALGSQHCETGYCDPLSLVCALIPLGGECLDRVFCASGAVCASPFGTNDGPFCLEVGLGVDQTCSDPAQCTGQPGLTCNEEGKCRPSNGKEDGERCGGASECQSGICEDEIADDGFERVCLTPNLENGQGCSHRYQCQSDNCAAGADGALTCQDKGEPITSPVEPPVTQPSSNPTNPEENERQQPEVVVITTVQNGQTLTLTQTRTITVRGSSTAGTTQRLVSASASARASGAAVVGTQVGGALGWVLAGAAAMLGGAVL